jgi:dTDP-4-dehydrorhamnose 3,5-epimerase
MDVKKLAIEAVKLLQPRRVADSRGYFAEIWNRQVFAAAGIDVDFVQDNQSFSKQRATVRGLHFQRPPRAQAKLIRVVRGSVFDVAVDLRCASPTFGQHTSAVLTAESGEQLFIPIGFAHGLCTLEPDTEVQYKVSDFYAREHDAGILWDDPDLGIAWPLGGAEPVLSDRDRQLPRFREIGPLF